MIETEEVEAPWNNELTNYLNGIEESFFHDNSHIKKFLNGIVSEEEVKTVMKPSTTAEEASKKTMCLCLTIRRFGTRRKASTDLIDTDADKGLIYLGKDILDSPELKAIQTLHGEVRQYIRKRALPGTFLKNGLYLVAAKSAPDINSKIEWFITEEKKLVAKFLETYENRVEEARERLKTLFNATDYPPANQLEALFGIKTNWLSLKVNESLKEINKEIWQREQEKFEDQWQQTLLEVRDGLRQGLSDMIGHLVERLTPGTDGKKKTFKKATIENLREFLDVFDSKNITSDEELKSVADKARQLLEGVNPDDIRKYSPLKEAMVEGFEALKGQLDTLVVEGPSRKYTLDEEE